jgi:hypothetical protein
MGAALTTYRDGGTTRHGRRASKVERCNVSEPVADTPRFVNGSNLVDLGRGSAWTAFSDGVPTRHVPCPMGAPRLHAKLRSACGEAAGAKLGTTPTSGIQ